MRRLLALLLLCWAALLYAGDATMPGDRGRIRPPVPEVSQFFSRGLPNGTRAPTKWNPFYIGGFTQPAAFSAMSTPGDQLHVMPLLTSRTGTISKIEALTNAAAVTVGEVCGLGIYDSRNSATEVYPKNLLYQTGSLDMGCSQCQGGTRVGLNCTTDDTNATTGCPGATCPLCCLGNFLCSVGTRSGLQCTTDDTNATTGCPGATCPNCCQAKTQCELKASPQIVLPVNQVYWLGVWCNNLASGAGARGNLWCYNSGGAWMWMVNLNAASATPWTALNVYRFNSVYSATFPSPFSAAGGAIVDFTNIPCVPIVAVQFSG